MTILQVVLDNLLDVAMVFATTMAPVIATKGIRWLEARTGLQASEAQEAKVRDMLDRALHYAEESAHKRLRKGEAEMGDGVRKMAKALDFARAEASRLGLGSVITASAGHLEDMLEARLGAKRHDPDDPMDATPTEQSKLDAKAAAAAAAAPAA